jgi:hypothetical protein
MLNLQRALIVCCLGATLVLAQDASNEGPGRRPLVVLKQTAIRGRVFLLNEAEEGDVRGVNVKVEVWTERGGRRLVDTKTDDKGEYTLPNLETGTYELRIGRLRLDLKVMEPADRPSGSRVVPKTIVVFIPASLRR